MMCVRVRSLVAIDEDLCLPVCCLSTECVRVVVCQRPSSHIPAQSVVFLSPSPPPFEKKCRRRLPLSLLTHTHAHTRLDSTLTP